MCKQYSTIYTAEIVKELLRKKDAEPASGGDRHPSDAAERTEEGGTDEAAGTVHAE